MEKSLAAGTGKAYMLKFDWREDEFRKFVGEPDLKLDWKNQPWLHVWYNKFFFKNSDRIEDFVSVWKEKELQGCSILFSTWVETHAYISLP